MMNTECLDFFSNKVSGVGTWLAGQRQCMKSRNTKYWCEICNYKKNNLSS